jgi:hypothetical protein
MDPLLTQALRAGRAPSHRRSTAPRVLVAGGAGVLGAAVLEHLLGIHAFSQVSVVVNQPLGAALRGLHPVLWPHGLAPRPELPGVETAVVVFDRERHANGREQPFFKPDPQHLPLLADSLHRAGVRHLLVVLPHDATRLPRALRHGLANLDEHAVAQLGFEHLVFMRAAQPAPGAVLTHPGERLARWMLSQLQLMVPQRDRPVRASKVAAFAAQLAARLAASPPGTRVVPPELVWEAAQAKDSVHLASDWLAGHPLVAIPLPTLKL